MPTKIGASHILIKTLHVCGYQEVSDLQPRTLGHSAAQWFWRLENSQSRMQTQNRDFSVLEDRRSTYSWKNSVYAPKPLGQSRTVAGELLLTLGKRGDRQEYFRSTDMSQQPSLPSSFLPMAKRNSKEECKSIKAQRWILKVLSEPPVTPGLSGHGVESWCWSCKPSLPMLWRTLEPEDHETNP